MAKHIPVLLHNTLEALDLKRGEIVLDATVGGGGHSREICKRIGESGTLIALDADAENLARAKKALAPCPSRTVFLEENFRNIDAALERAGVKEVDAIVFDIGLSSFHLEESGRGFSFRKDEPLAMTFSANEKAVTAYEVVNEWGEDTLVDIFYGFGEERFARRIARGIIDARAEKPIKRTGELVEIIEASVPRRYAQRRIHPATRAFQAIRMAVNDELGALSEGLEKGVNVLASGGRIAVITFHSGEDRIVKRFFRQKAADGELAIVTKRPATPSTEETHQNPRARSAKLRVAQKT